MANNMLMVTGLIYIGPMPENPVGIGAYLPAMISERHLTHDDLWYTLNHYWPSFKIPPYPIPGGWIWAWIEEEEVWEMVSIN